MSAESQDRLGLIIGHSSETARIRHRIEKLARSTWPVLVLGETGTGKEVAARAIHNAGPGGPFVVVDCSAMVGPLMESELFGHAKGAFTGAVMTKTGLMEMANGGTVFLDEIGEMPMDQQAKLLRVIQEKQYRPVGSLQQRHADFRVIAATNRDLPKEVERGTFRGDLYYRLNVVTLRIAPLRERTDDIADLVRYFIGKHGRNHVLTQETIDALMSYPWPGNVRELEHCIQHMVAINSGPLLHLADLPTSLANFRLACKPQTAAATVNGAARALICMESFSSSAILPLREVERQAILRALEYTKGDRVTAAALLGIGRTTLYRKLKEYAVPE
jgi:DNA-binding NtrC family response regulator